MEGNVRQAVEQYPKHSLSFAKTGLKSSVQLESIQEEKTSKNKTESKYSFNNFKSLETLEQQLIKDIGSKENNPKLPTSEWVGSKKNSVIELSEESPQRSSTERAKRTDSPELHSRSKHSKEETFNQSNSEYKHKDDVNKNRGKKHKANSKVFNESAKSILVAAEVSAINPRMKDEKPHRESVATDRRKQAQAMAAKMYAEITSSDDSTTAIEQTPKKTPFPVSPRLYPGLKNNVTTINDPLTQKQLQGVKSSTQEGKGSTKLSSLMAQQSKKGLAEEPKVYPVRRSLSNSIYLLPEKEREKMALKKAQEEALRLQLLNNNITPKKETRKNSSERKTSPDSPSKEKEKLNSNSTKKGVNPKEKVSQGRQDRKNSPDPPVKQRSESKEKKKVSPEAPSKTTKKVFLENPAKYYQASSKSNINKELTDKGSKDATLKKKAKRETSPTPSKLSKNPSDKLKKNINIEKSPPVVRNRSISTERNSRSLTPKPLKIGSDVKGSTAASASNIVSSKQKYGTKSVFSPIRTSSPNSQKQQTISKSDSIHSRKKNTHAATTNFLQSLNYSKEEQPVKHKKKSRLHKDEVSRSDIGLTVALNKMREEFLQTIPGFSKVKRPTSEEIKRIVALDKFDVRVRKALFERLRKKKLEMLESNDMKKHSSDPGTRKGFVWSPPENQGERNKEASNTSLPSVTKHLNCEEFEEFSYWKTDDPATKPAWEKTINEYRQIRSGPLDPASARGQNINRPAQTSVKGRMSINRVTRDNTTWNPVNVEPSTDQKRIDVANWIASVPTPTGSIEESDKDTESVKTARTKSKDSVATKSRCKISSRNGSRTVSQSRSPCDQTQKDAAPNSKKSGQTKAKVVKEKPWCFSLSDTGSRKSSTSSREKSKQKTKLLCRRVSSSKLNNRYHNPWGRKTRHCKDAWTIMVPLLKASCRSKMKLRSGGLLTRQNYNIILESMNCKDTKGLTLVMVDHGWKDYKKEKEMSNLDYEQSAKSESKVFTIGFVKDEDLENTKVEGKSQTSLKDSLILDIVEPSSTSLKKPKCDLMVEESKFVIRPVKNRPSALRKMMLEYSKYVQSKRSLGKSQKSEGSVTNVNEEPTIEIEEDPEVKTLCEKNVERESPSTSTSLASLIPTNLSHCVAGVAAFAFLLIAGFALWSNVSFVATV